MIVQLGIGMKVVDTVLGGPPDRSILQCQATGCPQYELKPRVGSERAMREVAMMSGMDAHLHHQPDNQSGNRAQCHTSTIGSQRQMEEEKNPAAADQLLENTLAAACITRRWH